ncbi:hypothetical protein P9112_000573 [Eukaryota sp. TZLM1-RC]
MFAPPTLRSRSSTPSKRRSSTPTRLHQGTSSILSAITSTPRSASRPSSACSRSSSRNGKIIGRVSTNTATEMDVLDMSIDDIEAIEQAERKAAEGQRRAKLRLKLRQMKQRQEDEEAAELERIQKEEFRHRRAKKVASVLVTEGLINSTPDLVVSPTDTEQKVLAEWDKLLHKRASSTPRSRSPPQEDEQVHIPKVMKDPIPAEARGTPRKMPSTVEEKKPVIERKPRPPSVGRRSTTASRNSLSNQPPRTPTHPPTTPRRTPSRPSSASRSTLSERSKITAPSSTSSSRPVSATRKRPVETTTPVTQTSTKRPSRPSSATTRPFESDTLKSVLNNVPLEFTVPRSPVQLSDLQSSMEDTPARSHDIDDPAKRLRESKKKYGRLSVNYAKKMEQKKKQKSPQTSELLDNLKSSRLRINDYFNNTQSSYSPLTERIKNVAEKEGIFELSDSDGDL